jgi:hypothetical protein
MQMQMQMRMRMRMQMQMRMQMRAPMTLEVLAQEIRAAATRDYSRRLT